MSKAVDGPAAAPVAKPVKVALTGLKLTDFRNYASLSLDLAAPLIVLTGPNGAGKTNCLEAISLLTPGRGLRRAPYEALVRSGTVAGWALAIDLARDGEAVRIFAEAFGKDIEFFAFYRSMEAYREALGSDDTTMVLSPDSEFFRFFGNFSGELSGGAE